MIADAPEPTGSQRNEGRFPHHDSGRPSDAALTLFDCLTALAFSAAISLDSFATGFTYGTQKLRIPIATALAMSAVSCLVLSLAVSLGHLFGALLPASSLGLLCGALLFAVGGFKFLSACGEWFGTFSPLPLLRDAECADVDRSRVLSVPESVFLALVLSLDNFAGAGLSDFVSPALPVVFCFLINTAALLSGDRLGLRFARKSRLNLSWLSGIVLMLLALARL